MQTSLEILLTPAEFVALSQRDLAQSVCIVFDVLRATTSMLTALSNGAARIFPVKEIAEAVELRGRRPAALLAGERDGLLIRASKAGGIDFDLGNSPREFTAQKVAGKEIIMTTTNGTRALQACVGAKRILVGAVLNLGALAQWIENEQPSRLLIVCAGTYEEAAYEDTLAAGALCDLIWERFQNGATSDSAHIAREIYLRGEKNLGAALQHSRNARRLLGIPELRDDVAFCWRRDVLDLIAEMRDNSVQDWRTFAR